MRTTRLILAALAAASLAGCSSGDADPEPSPTLSASVSGPATTAPATLDPEAQAEKCVQAIVDQASTNPAELKAEPRPAGCEGLDDAAYLEAYYDALAEVNKKGRDALSGGSTGG